MDDEQQREREDLISRLFALIAMKLEDGAGVAADCQGRRSAEDLRQGVAKLEPLVTEAAMIIAAASALLADYQ